VDKILAHVGLPVELEVLADGCTLAFDVTGELRAWLELKSKTSREHVGEIWASRGIDAGT
jgi:hypothetical protein